MTENGPSNDSGSSRGDSGASRGDSGSSRRDFGGGGRPRGGRPNRGFGGRSRDGQRRSWGQDRDSDNRGEGRGRWQEGRDERRSSGRRSDSWGDRRRDDRGEESRGRGRFEDRSRGEGRSRGEWSDSRSRGAGRFEGNRGEDRFEGGRGQRRFEDRSRGEGRSEDRYRGEGRPRGEGRFQDRGRGGRPGGPSRGGGRGQAGSHSAQGREFREERRERRETPIGLAPRGPEPELPEDLDLRLLPRGVKAELRGLPRELADKVAPRLLLAGQLIDEDPKLAYDHALVARRLAARLPIVRAAVAECAYAVGEYAVALSEYRALRRMSGGDEYLPVMADCERALGRPEEALELVAQAVAADIDPAMAVEARIVEAGARSDMGQHAEAVRLLRNEIKRTKSVELPLEAAARLRYAYADLLLAGGDEDGARSWFEAVAKLDRDGTTDVTERLAQLDGLVIDFDDSEDEDDLPPSAPADEQAEPQSTEDAAENTEEEPQA